MRFIFCMSKIMIFMLLILILTGCETILPVKQHFPVPPNELMEDCDQLDKVKDNAQFSEFLTTVANNYNKYHICAEKKKLFTKWYTDQKVIYDK